MLAGPKTIIASLIVAFSGLAGRCTPEERPLPAPLEDAGQRVQSGSDSSTSARAKTAQSPALKDDFQGTAGIIDRQKPDSPLRLLSDVRTGGHRHYDRIVFEFKDGLPSYHLEYIDRPVRQCGSGDPTQIAGDGWLEVRFNPSDAHTSEGKPTIRERERQLQMEIIRELELTCDYEAYVTWVVGVGIPNRYRVLELSDPPRLVVDIHH